MAKNTVDVTDADLRARRAARATSRSSSTSGRSGAARARWSPRSSTRSPARTSDKLTVAKLDIDANPATARDYQVMSIPTMIVFQDGKPVKQIVGAKPKAALLRDLADYLAPAARPGGPGRETVRSGDPVAPPSPTGHRSTTRRVTRRHARARCRPVSGGRAQWSVPRAGAGTSRRPDRARSACSCCAEVTVVRRSPRSATLGSSACWPTPRRHADDHFDADVEQAVRAFQQRRGLITDGIVGPATYRALREAGWRLGDRMLALLISAPMSGDDVVALQERLLELGYDPGRPSGVFDEQTERGAAGVPARLRPGPRRGLCGPATLRRCASSARKVTGGRPAPAARAGAAAPGRARGCAASGS